GAALSAAGARRGGTPAMKRALVLLVLLVAGAAGLVGGGGYGLGPVVITKEGQQKIILIFGRPRAVTTPGVALRVPLLENVRELDRRPLYLNPPPPPHTTRAPGG